MIRKFSCLMTTVLALAMTCAAQTRPAKPGDGDSAAIERARRVAPRESNSARSTYTISDPGGILTNYFWLDQQLRNTIPAEVATQLGVAKDALLSGYRVMPTMSRGSLYGARAYQISVELPGEQVKATDALQAIVMRFQDMVTSEANAQMQLKGAYAQKMEQEARDRVNQINDRAEKLRDEAREKSGRFEVSPETFRAAMSKLDDERQGLLIDKESETARVQALQEIIADQSKRIEDSVKSDVISEELQKVVQYREQAAKTLEQQYKAGVATASDATKAQAELADARVRLAERREALAGSGSGQLGSWNKELLNLNIEMRQKTARLGAVEKALKQLQSAMPLLDALSRMQDQLQLARAELARAQTEMNTARKEARDRRMPTVTEERE